MKTTFLINQLSRKCSLIGRATPPPLPGIFGQKGLRKESLEPSHFQSLVSSPSPLTPRPPQPKHHVGNVAQKIELWTYK